MLSGRFIVVQKSRCGLFLIASLLAFSGFGAFCGFGAFFITFLVALLVAFLVTLFVALLFAGFLAVLVALLVFLLTAFGLVTFLFAFLDGSLCAEAQAEGGHSGHKHKFLHSLQSVSDVFTDEVAASRVSRKPLR